MEPRLPDTPPAPARLAATVILLRDAGPEVETLLVRRHSAIAFLGGAWVFPGGKLEAADRAPEAVLRLPAQARARAEEWCGRPGRPCSASDASGLYVAACRETFEEAGVLLARHEDGTVCGRDDLDRLHGQRDEIRRRPSAFVEMLVREGLSLDARLLPWAHWVTPSLERIRFDARFFVAAVPADQRVVLDASESTDHVWTTPRAAVDAFERGEIVLASPTLLSLLEVVASLEAHGTIGGLLAAEAGRAIPPILPKLRREPHEILAVMPWDEEYDSLPGEGRPLAGDSLPLRLSRLPSRLALPLVETRIVDRGPITPS
jgi:8-oxo-dGTP pyrophosphatase MutT (NUDIX family)